MKIKLLYFPLIWVMVASCIDKKPIVSERPNIVFIIGDDVGWNDIGCYGNSGVKTPNIDRLANEGILFNNAFLTASSCNVVVI